MGLKDSILYFYNKKEADAVVVLVFIILKKLLPLGSSFLCYQQCICATIINYRLVIEHKRIERC